MSLLGKSGAIQIRIFNIYINVINDHSPPPPPPFHILFLLLAIYQCLRVFQLTFVKILACLQSPIAFSFVCLSVCLSVCNVNDTGRAVRAINTKLGTHMCLGSGYMCILFGVDGIIDDVIRSKYRSKFETAITPSIFELERRTKYQNVGNGMTYLGVGLNFRYNFRFKAHPDLKVAAILKFS